MQKPRIYYGWFIVVAGFLGNVTAGGIQSFTFGVIFKPMADALGSVAVILSATAIALGAWRGLDALVALTLDREPPADRHRRRVEREDVAIGIGDVDRVLGDDRRRPSLGLGDGATGGGEQRREQHQHRRQHPLSAHARPPGGWVQGHSRPCSRDYSAGCATP